MQTAADTKQAKVCDKCRGKGFVVDSNSRVQNSGKKTTCINCRGTGYGSGQYLTK